jgi:hypothetical protein
MALKFAYKKRLGGHSGGEQDSFCIIDKLRIAESSYDHFGGILDSYLSD